MVEDAVLHGPIHLGGATPLASPRTLLVPHIAAAAHGAGGRTQHSAIGAAQPFVRMLNRCYHAANDRATFVTHARTIGRASSLIGSVPAGAARFAGSPQLRKLVSPANSC